MKNNTLKLNLKNIFVYGLYSLSLISIIISFLYLKNYTNQISNKIDKVIYFIENNQWEEGENIFEEFNTIHKNKLENLSFVLKHTDINDILLSIVNISSNIRLRNKEMSLVSLENLKFYIENMYKNQLPKLENIL